MTTGKEWELDLGESYDRFENKLQIIKDSQANLQSKLQGPKLLDSKLETLSEKLLKQLLAYRSIKSFAEKASSPDAALLMQKHRASYEMICLLRGLFITLEFIFLEMYIGSSSPEQTELVFKNLLTTGENTEVLFSNLEKDLLIILNRDKDGEDLGNDNDQTPVLNRIGS